MEHITYTFRLEKDKSEIHWLKHVLYLIHEMNTVCSQLQNYWHLVREWELLHKNKHYRATWWSSGKLNYLPGRRWWGWWRRLRRFQWSQFHICTVSLILGVKFHNQLLDTASVTASCLEVLPESNLHSAVPDFCQVSLELYVVTRWD